MVFEYDCSWHRKIRRSVGCGTNTNISKCFRLEDNFEKTFNHFGCGITANPCAFQIRWQHFQNKNNLRIFRMDRVPLDDDSTVFISESRQFGLKSRTFYAVADVVSISQAHKLTFLYEWHHRK